MEIELVTGVFRLRYAALLGVVLLLVVACKTSAPENVDVTVQKSERLTRVDKLCLELSKPVEFKLVSKNLGGNNLKADIGHLFKADINFDAVRDFYFARLPVAGWSYDEAGSYLDQGYFTFKKEKFIVFVSKVGFRDANYVIRCQEELQ